jgi:hypothetical protein
VAVHPVISTEKPPEERAESEETEQVPRTYSGRTLAITLAIAGAGVVVSLLVTLLHSGAAPQMLPPVTMQPSPVAVAEPTPLPKVIERIGPEPRPRLTHMQHAAAEGPARLSVDCDVAANVFVDGQFVAVTPMANLEVTPGAHTVRAESSALGLRLIPREENVVLKAGEARHLTMDLK